MGAAAYFLWPAEPSLAAGLLVSIAGVAAFAGLRAGRAYLIAVFVLWAGFMFAYSQWRTLGSEQVFLNERYDGRVFWVTGQIIDRDRTATGVRVQLEHVKIYGIPPNETPKRLSIGTSRGRFGGLDIGDWASVQTKLFTIDPAAYNGAWDRQFYAYFDEKGAAGMVYGQVYATTPLGNGSIFFPTINRWREQLAERLEQVDAPPAARGVGIALLTGKRGLIPDEIRDAYRHSGLAHLLAISGLHLALVAGLFFVLARRLLAHHPRLPLHTNVKVPAAVMGLVATLCYMFLAGSTIPTVRAAVMIALLFGAVFLARRRNTLRALAVAAIIVLLLWPQSVVGASFQMSFAAVLALALWAQLREREIPSSVKLVQLGDYIKATFASSVVAGLATLPFAALHFQLISLSGFFINVLAIPLTGLLVLPLGLLAAGSVMLGFNAPVQAYFMAVEKLNALAIWGADLPLAGLTLTPATTPIAIAAAVVALVLYLLCRYRLCLGVVAALAAFLLFWPQSVPFDVAILRGGQTVLVQTKGRDFTLARGDGSYAEQSLLSGFTRRYGLNVAGRSGHCDAKGCIYTMATKRVFIPNAGQVPDGEDCRLSDLIIAQMVKKESCPPLVSRQGAAARLVQVEEELYVEAFNPPVTRAWHR